MPRPRGSSRLPWDDDWWQSRPEDEEHPRGVLRGCDLHPPTHERAERGPCRRRIGGRDLFGEPVRCRHLREQHWHAHAYNPEYCGVCGPRVCVGYLPPRRGLLTRLRGVLRR